MKKLLCFIVAAVLAVSCTAVCASAESSDYVIDDGVLIRYNGSAASVVIPDGVYSVAASAFEGNTSVRTVRLPSTVFSIGDRAFYRCTSLTEVTGGSVSTVGMFAFNETPYFEQSTAEFFILGSCLLWYNGNSSKVELDEGIVSIAPFAFLQCDNMTSFTAHGGLVSVGEGAFSGCTSLLSVSLPKTVSYIGSSAFDGTAYLSQLSGFGVLGDGILVKYSGSDTVLTVPDNVRRIGAGAFKDNTALTELTLPSQVYSVDQHAFDGCSKLKSLTLSRGIVYIGDHAFSGCTSLESLETPSTLAYIGDSAFFGCSSLDHVCLDGSKLTVSSYAFADCTSLGYALLSGGVGELEDYAFAGCSGMMGISVTSETLIIGTRALNNCKNATVFCESGSFAASVLSECKIYTVIGDTDFDGELSILDATLIQRHLAQIDYFAARQICAADIDGDGSVSILDATRAQRILAGFVT